MRSLLVQKFYMRAGSCVEPSSLFHIPRVLVPHLLLLSSHPLWSVTRASGLLAPLTPFLEQPPSTYGGKTQRLTFILPEPTSQTLLFPSLTALWTMGRSFRSELAPGAPGRHPPRGTHPFSPGAPGEVGVACPPFLLLSLYFQFAQGHQSGLHDQWTLSFLEIWAN